MSSSNVIKSIAALVKLEYEKSMRLEGKYKDVFEGMTQRNKKQMMKGEEIKIRLNYKKMLSGVN